MPSVHNPKYQKTQRKKRKTSKSRKQKGGDPSLWTSGTYPIPKIPYNDYAGTDFSRSGVSSRDLSWMPQKGGKKFTKKNPSIKCIKCERESRKQKGGNILSSSAYNFFSNPVGGIYDSAGVFTGDVSRTSQTPSVNPAPYEHPINHNQL